MDANRPTKERPNGTRLYQQAMAMKEALGLKRITTLLNRYYITESEQVILPTPTPEETPQKRNAEHQSMLCWALVPVTLTLHVIASLHYRRTRRQQRLFIPTLPYPTATCKVARHRRPSPGH